MADDYMLTTTDNPFDPFTHYTEWYGFDAAMGYHTPEVLARVAKTSFDLSDADNEQAVQDAIDEIVRENVLGIYRKVSRNNSVAVGGGGLAK